MIESIVFLKGSKHNYPGHSIGELNDHDQSNITAIDGKLQELYFLMENSVIDVFTNPIYQTGLEADQAKLTEHHLSIEKHYYSGDCRYLKFMSVYKNKRII